MNAYSDLLDHIRRTALLGSTAGLLSWDQETMMPEGGESVARRAAQLAMLAGMVHERSTDPRIADWLAACESDPVIAAEPTGFAAVNVREIRREYDRQTKLPQKLVEEFARVTAQSKAAWAEARGRNDYPAFRPWLEKIIALNREKAKCWGWAEGGEPWDALAEGFEPGMTAKQIEPLFAGLRRDLVPLVKQLTDSGREPSTKFSALKLPRDQQEKFVRFVAGRIGFDFTRGRLDVSAHPFCDAIHRDDVRMTTRFHDDNLPDSLGSTMHESGHGIYEQNLPGGEHVGTPMGSAVSLSIHESQSRLWENPVGRSAAFWQWLFPQLPDFFGDAVRGLSFEDAYGSVNRVKPSLIRTEADEATYNLHIMIRFELERAMIRGDLGAADLPAEWNRRYGEYLGLTVPDDRRGCMQDIHWSMGAMGYFPTYTLGNIYAAQFFAAARRQIGDVDAQLARGEFHPLRAWLTQEIHSQGMRYRSADLCRVVTGEEPSPAPLLTHLREKFGAVYGLA